MFNRIQTWLNPRQPRAEVSKAKDAVLRFWSTFSLNVGQPATFFSEPGTYTALFPYFREVKPFPGLRNESSYGPLDYLAPSAWHALAFLTVLDLQARSVPAQPARDPAQFTEVYGQRPIYRGQARPWPLMPSGWHSPDVTDNWRRQVLRELLANLAGPTEDPVLELVGQVVSQSQADAVAQHFGLVTNLLDFTFSPVTAVYFACGFTKKPPVRTAMPVPKNCGVVFLAPFGNPVVQAHARTELPPVTLERLYRQVGLFLDMGEPDKARDKRANLEGQMRRVFFPRDYPKTVEQEEFKSLLIDHEPIVPFLTELVDLVKQACPIKVTETPAEVAKRLAGMVNARPPWRSTKHDPIWWMTDDELLRVYRQIEYYIRFAGLINVRGEASLNPCVIGPFYGALLIPFLRFGSVVDKLREIAQEQQQTSESVLSTIDWFNSLSFNAFQEYFTVFPDTDAGNP